MKLEIHFSLMLTFRMSFFYRNGSGRRSGILDEVVAEERKNLLATGFSEIAGFEPVWGEKYAQIGITEEFLFSDGEVNKLTAFAEHNERYYVFTQRTEIEKSEGLGLQTDIILEHFRWLE